MPNPKQRKMKMALDLDGVTYGTFRVVHRMINEANGTNFPYRELRYPTYPTPEIYDLAVRFFDQLWIMEPGRIKLLDPTIPRGWQG
jgi:hypothetical protein